MSIILGILLVISSSLLIVLVLIQQGRGGGLAGAFGGMGGQSAFGTKAGDVFTRVTIIVAAAWIFLCVVTVKWASTDSSPFGAGLGANAPNIPGAADAPNGSENSPAGTSTDGQPTGRNEPAAEKESAK
jgi:preprotein translocase subunit SecG